MTESTMAFLDGLQGHLEDLLIFELQRKIFLNNRLTYMV